jgi:hypothetical protein
MAISILTAEEAAAAIERPLKDWPGKCHEVASAIVAAGLVEGVARYGHYRGKVAESSMFFGLSIVHHGWIELDDGGVCDPLRWEFEGVEPYILFSWDEDVLDEYDLGGSRVRDAVYGGCPEVQVDDAQYRLPRGQLMWFVLAQIPNAIEAGLTHVDDPVLNWFANRSPDWLGDEARGVYEWVRSFGHNALIPIDYQRKVFGDE